MMERQPLNGCEYLLDGLVSTLTHLAKANPRALIFAYRPRMIVKVPVADVVGDIARTSTSASPLFFCIPSQCRRSNDVDTAAVDAAASSPWRTWSVRIVVPTSALTHQLRGLALSEARSAHVVANAKSVTAMKRRVENRTSASCCHKPANRAIAWLLRSTSL